MKTSMRYLAVIFAVAMMLCALTVSANTFEDVKNDTPHAKAIESLTSLGIIHGYEDNTFKPTLPVRRDEMAKLVYTTFTNSTDAGEGVTTFPDVPANSWAKGYISWCAGKDIVGGYEDGTFKPEGNVTYDEALKMVCAMLGYTDFNPEIWPIDVRLKALIDLNLGEGLEDVAGDAAITRAQVAQLFHNSLDEQMYTPAPEETKVGNLTVVAPAQAPTTLAADVWGYTELEVQIVATENYAIEAAYKVKEGAAVRNDIPPFNTYNQYSSAVSINDIDYLAFTKTSKEDTIVVCYIDENGQFVADKVVDEGEGTYEYVPKTITLDLEEINLTSYEGKTDELIARNISLFIDKEGNYFSSTLKGNISEGFSATYGAIAGISETDVSYTGDPIKQLSHRYSTHGLTLNGVDHHYENFYKIRNLVFLPEGKVLSIPTYAGAHSVTTFYVDKDMNLINRVFYHGAVGDAVENNTPTGDYRYNFPAALILNSSYVNTRKAIDSDGDGYYDYVTIAYSKPYKVVSTTKSSIKLQSLTDTTYEVTYAGETFHSELDRPKEGDIIVGHLVGDDFYHESTAKTITGFATKYSAGDSSSSVNIYGYGSYSTNTNLHAKRYTYPGNTILKSVINSINTNSSFIGYDIDKGDYNYVTYYLYNDTIIYATVATEAEKKAAMGGQNKAILQFVDKPTELQINEKTKRYEVFYPAYLLINGKEELVNLKPTAAINGTEAETVAQNGSMYRAYVKDGVVMYPNILVEFVIDTDGYYSLTTSDGVDKDIEEEGVVTGKVIGKNGYYLTINPDTKVMSIIDAGADKDDDSDDTVILTKVTVDESSVLYYTYTTPKTTGAHEHIGFYYGNEVPAEFGKIELTGDTFLAYDKEEKLWVIETTMLALDGFEGVAVIPDAGNYMKDARLHLLALTGTEAEYDSEKKETYATYNFKNIYEGADVSTVNKELEYKYATKAEINKMYAWDAETEDYVLLDADFDAYSEEKIDYVMKDLSLVFTDANADGYKVNEDTKVLAVKNIPNEDNEEFILEEITVDDIDTLLTVIDEYNEYYNDGADYTMTARIGTYVDENRKTQLAYIIIDWVEYNAELEAYTFAGIK
ncbi:MAG: S-layer homology domain-containing protein [Clostridia bacterium]|nr:S-layer homology domain-containing protein [Clostridia bacterium]